MPTEEEKEDSKLCRRKSFVDRIINDTSSYFQIYNMPQKRVFGACAIMKQRLSRRTSKFIICLENGFWCVRDHEAKAKSEVSLYMCGWE